MNRIGLRVYGAGLLGCAVLLGSTQAAVGAGAVRYPSKPLRMMVGFPPGGGADIMSRLIGRAARDARVRPKARYRTEREVRHAGSRSLSSTPNEFARFIRANSALWERVVMESGK